jgi:phage shock protein PspC (stress-responsive transcriptional regulator)
MKLYGGTLADENGIAKTFNINTNLLGFSIALVILVIGFLLILY